MPAMPSMARRPLLSSLVAISVSSALEPGLRPSGSKPRSPASMAGFGTHQPPSSGFSSAATVVVASMAPMARTTIGQKVWSGVCWNARNEGTSMSPPKSGWNDSPTRKPVTASMATRECFNSASRKYFRRFSDLPSASDSGSKKPGKSSVTPTPSRTLACIAAVRCTPACGAKPETAEAPRTRTMEESMMLRSGGVFVWLTV
mmetsp:Transcript_5497/g.19890  ORF Transcript_5497/g.19890 Transcript_5497/m.19890 type:complete len:202 (-) Transcript_5497:16-621(-)